MGPNLGVFLQINRYMGSSLFPVESDGFTGVFWGWQPPCIMISCQTLLICWQVTPTCHHNWSPRPPKNRAVPSPTVRSAKKMIGPIDLKSGRDDPVAGNFKKRSIELPGTFKNDRVTNSQFWKKNAPPLETGHTLGAGISPSEGPTRRPSDPRRGWECSQKSEHSRETLIWILMELWSTDTGFYIPG